MLECQNTLGDRENERSYKKAKQITKNSLLAKICDGPMFHLATTGNDDDLQ
jgi:hypothetical protein